MCISTEKLRVCTEKCCGDGRRKFDFLYTDVFFSLGIGDIYVLLSGPLSNLSSRKDFIISAQATYSTRGSDSYTSLVASYIDLIINCVYGIGNGSFVGFGALLGQIVKTKSRDVHSISNKIEFDIIVIVSK